jgi:transcriptional regulator with XRE-family HTH domain
MSSTIEGLLVHYFVAMSESFDSGVPDVGAILKRLRLRRGLTLRDVGEAVDLSPSFLSAVERGASDIALGRLARVAAFFGHDVGSLLGYSARQARPQFVEGDDRTRVDRGTGIDYEVLRIPGLHLELVLMEFEPRTQFSEEITHEGVDILVVQSGRLTVTINGVGYPVASGECAVWSAAYPHGMRNETDEPASAFGIVTETVY